MNCNFHPDREASAYCSSCGRPLCGEDQRTIWGVIYCPECAARQPNPGPGAGSSATAVPGGIAIPPGAPNPGLALGLGFIPGVGAIYNGQYFKAFIQVVIFGFLCYMSNAPFGDIFGLGSAAFYFYMVIDSYRSARAICLGQPVEDFPGLGTVRFTGPIGAVVLIVIGAVLLLRSLGFFQFEVLRYFWPVLLIVIGALMLDRQRRKT